MRLLGVLLVCTFAALLSPVAWAVKRHDFKTCQQSGFCRRNRALADRQAATKQWKSPYTLSSPSYSDGQFAAAVSNALFPYINFSLQVRFQQDGVARVRMDEVDGLRQRLDEFSA